jgi:hypothetical protein
VASAAGLDLSDADHDEEALAPGQAALDVAAFD